MTVLYQSKKPQQKARNAAPFLQPISAVILSDVTTPTPGSWSFYFEVRHLSTSARLFHLSTPKPSGGWEFLFWIHVFRRRGDLFFAVNNLGEDQKSNHPDLRCCPRVWWRPTATSFTMTKHKWVMVRKKKHGGEAGCGEFRVQEQAGVIRVAPSHYKFADDTSLLPKPKCLRLKGNKLSPKGCEHWLFKLLLM